MSLFEPKRPQVTILTPTWNRRHLLPRLYQSLVEQVAPSGSFEWLVVDDGSTDGTFDWLEALILEAPFSIRVIRQVNGGKHRALNRAARELVSPWVLVVDSDDWLLSGAIQQALDDIVHADADPAVLAIIAPRDLKGSPQRSFTPVDRTVTFAYWHGQTHVGDASILMRSNILQKFPFPEYEKESFVPESAVYGRAFKCGGIFLSADRIVGAEYQAGGLSARSLQLRISNALGALAAYDAHLKSGLTGRLRLRSLLNYHRFFWHAWHSGKNTGAQGFQPYIHWLLPGWLLYLRDRMRQSHGA